VGGTWHFKVVELVVLARRRRSRPVEEVEALISSAMMSDLGRVETSSLWRLELDPTVVSLRSLMLN